MTKSTKNRQTNRVS